MSFEIEPLHRLAALYGVETAYGDYTGATVQARPEALLAVLRALGARVETLDDVPRALREAPAARESVAIDAGRAHPLFDDDDKRGWGLFAPAYALRDRRDLGVGDLSHLEALARWSRGLGAEVIATLPLTASFLDEPFEPSPYAPVSRRFWNELYLDGASAPEIEISETARALVASPGFQDEAARLRESERVDYAGAMKLKRGVLEALAKAFFEHPRESRMSTFRDFVDQHPRVEDYARFRAVMEHRREPWRRWPAAARDGVFDDADVDAPASRYHLYVQWLMHETVHRLGDPGKMDGARLCLDFPLGVHPDGYDLWRERELFADGVTVGAPPDEFFPGGQNWGFPPLHPERGRATGHRYLRECLRHHMRPASLLRIDHVMGLHRLFWIPQGFDARDGVYVRYPADELYALVCDESRRNRCAVVGEDLGTVPREVRPALARHGLDRAWVAQFEMTADANRPLPDPPVGAVASLNTHDTPTFAGFWSGRDIVERERLGLQGPLASRAMRERRAMQREALLSYLRRRAPIEGDELEAVMTGTLNVLAEGAAHLVLVNLDDLWFETEPQNIPGTHRQRANWRHRTRRTLEEMTTNRDLAEILRGVDRRRRGSA